MSFDVSQLEIPRPAWGLSYEKQGRRCPVRRQGQKPARAHPAIFFARRRWPLHGPLPPLAKVAHIDTIIVSSEKEGLLLENNLIKEYKPRYNALLKDDKTYIALKVNNKNKWPMVNLVRYRGKPETDGLYFGPYTSAQAARGTLDLLNRFFLRQCSDQELARRTRPCILYDMKRCIAPCVNKCTKQEYDHLVERTIKFLKGQNKEVVKELYEEMHSLPNPWNSKRLACS